MQAARPDLNESLKEGERGSTAGRHRLRNALVVAEVSLALVLLVGAGLMIKSFLRLIHVEPGFDPKNVLTVSMSLPSTKYGDTKQVSDFYTRLVARLDEQPGVVKAAAVNVLPMSGSGQTTNFLIDGRPLPPPNEEPEANYRAATPTYFDALGVPLREGRAFDDHDSSDAPPVAIVNETFVKKYFPGEDAVHKRLLDPRGKQPPTEIVGVVGDLKHWGLDDQPEPYLYVPHAQSGDNFMTLVVRTAGDPEQMTATVRREVLALDKDQPVFDVKTMEQRISEQSALKRLLTWLLGVMASVALVLAAIGIYGVIAYAVAQRTHEIGIRMALGARAGDILRLVLRQGMLMAVVGIALGLAGTVALMVYLSKVMTKFLFTVSGTDPATYAGVALLLAAVALLACVIPARRAMRVEPMAALRYE